ncbi:MAG TPA: ferritin-like domain-containing protein [Acetobacteraceae bacterium]|nr:ferritin-like domain-containing protein [Acetobacteraceae bacterium]
MMPLALDQPLPETLPPPPGGLVLGSLDHGDPAAIAAADHAARHWQWPEGGRLRPGSEAHRRATAAMFRDTFNPYKPSIIRWPHLEPAARHRLTSLPIWDIAVQTEGKARLRMLAYAQVLRDPDWQAAIELNGWEEWRHKQVLSDLVASYGIALEPEPPYLPPKDTEWAYLVTGFSECVDSFFAFGLFELAKRSGYFPAELVDTFEPVIQEEARHILLFANWLAAHRARLPLPRRIWFEARVWAVWAFLGWERVGIARGMDDTKGKPQDNNFTLNGSAAVADVDVSVPELMAICLDENDRRFAGYDARLRRPTTTPALARFAIRAFGLFGRRGRAPRPA